MIAAKFVSSVAVLLANLFIVPMVKYIVCLTFLIKKNHLHI